MAHNMDLDMDLDVDYGLEDDQNLTNTENYTATVHAPTDESDAVCAQLTRTLLQDCDAGLDAINAEPSKHSGTYLQQDNNSDGEGEDGEINENEAQPTKVHLRFTNHHLTTKDLKVWANNNCANPKVTRIEWVDDNSSNLIYHTSEDAHEALQKLSTVDITNEMQETRAKGYDVQPDTAFYVRIAKMGDVKAPNASAASKHYLEHPENDPVERAAARGGRYNNNNDRGRNTHRDNFHKSRGNYQNEGRQRGAVIDADLDTGSKPFDVNMYDDAAEMVSRSPYRRPQPTAAKTFSRELLPAKTSYNQGRLNSRSVSPARYPSRRDSRSASPPSHRNGDNSSRHFRSRSPLRRQARLESNPAPTNAKKELLSRGPAPRRSSALGSNGDLLSSASTAKNAGRLDGSDRGLSIKGSAAAAAAAKDRGFAIKGTARSSTPGAGAGDLFPKKLGHGDGDLLAGSGGRAGVGTFGRLARAGPDSRGS